MLVTSIEAVFQLLPPEREDIPERDKVLAATLCIQEFVVNAYGCLDNLAWIWVHERGLRAPPEGNDIDIRSVGLGESYWYLRREFTKPFQKYLRTRRSWIKHLMEFRDTLAHRIPLYIPPYIVDENSIKEYERLGQSAVEAMQRGDKAEFDRLMAEQKELGRFRPWMTRSPTEKSPNIAVHWQLLQDYVTIDEFGDEMLAELDRIAKLPPPETGKPKSPSRIQWAGVAVAGFLALIAAYMALR